MCRFLGRRSEDPSRAYVRPASEKRQGTKSREEIAGDAAGAMGIETGRGRCGAVIVRRR